jgi:AcrR family transcriptional regulator
MNGVQAKFEHRSRGKKSMKTTERRQNLKDALIDAAERSINARGLAGIKARDLATETGCAVGAIYNVVADLDELVLAVNARTLTMLENELTSAANLPLSADKASPDEAIAQLIRLAISYLRFAAANMQRWRAVFEHNLPTGKQLPEWYRDQQRRLFAVIEQPLEVLQPGLAPEKSGLFARSLFSAVHGVTILGLEEKLGAVSLTDLERQITTILSALGAGLSRRQDNAGLNT